MKNRFKTAVELPRKAFTLIEMLVVLLIVSVLIGVGAKVMKNATTAQGVDTAVPLAEGVFAQARSLAKSRGMSTRVVIYSDGGEGEERKKHLRYMGVVAQDVDKTTGEPITNGETPVFQDRLIARGITLPAKTYFNDNLSGRLPSTNVLIPGIRSSKSCYYYEFNSEGLLVEPNNSGANQPVGVFVVQAGKLVPTDDTPKELSPGNREAGGFAIWKRGNTSVFRSVDEIPGINEGEAPTFE